MAEKMNSTTRKEFIKNAGKVTAGAVIGGPLLTMLGCEPGIDMGVAVDTAEAAPYPFPFPQLDAAEVQAKTYEAYMEGG